MILVEKKHLPMGRFLRQKRQHSMPNRWFHVNPLTAYGGSEPCNWVWFWPTIPSKIFQYFDCVHASKMIFTIKYLPSSKKTVPFKVSLMCPRFQCPLWNLCRENIPDFRCTFSRFLTLRWWRRLELPSWELKNDHVWPPGCCSTLVSTWHIKKKVQYRKDTRNIYIQEILVHNDLLFISLSFCWLVTFFWWDLLVTCPETFL